MNVILALLPQLLVQLPAMKTGANEFIAWVRSIRKATQQTREWTPELEDAFLDALSARASDPAWQPHG